MTDWTQLLQDPAALKAIFGSEVPSLSGVEIHELSIRPDGPSVSLRFALESFPASPPRKWVDRHCNRIQLTLLAFSVTRLSVEGAARWMVGDLVLRQCDDNIELSFSCAEMSLKVSAKYLALNAINAYRVRDSIESA